MTLVALVTWLITASGGLYLLAIWLIEYDHEFQSAAATRLPVPVIGAHALLALGGLAVWVLYLITDTFRLVWITVVVLAIVVLLGLTMAVRWVGVYREHSAPSAVAVLTGAPGVSSGTPVPPERHFPLPVVIGHGIFATATILLVLLAALHVGKS
jgi:hypothetical protein